MKTVVVPRRLRALAAVLAIAAAAWVTGVGSAEASNGVVQNGLKNYAGPTCPGSDWTCSTNTANVRQTTTTGGENRFECVKGNACKALQTATGGGTNAASCNLPVKKSGKQSCDISQSNDTGTNTVSNSTLDASLSATKSETSQSSGQLFKIVQTNGAGADVIDITEQITQTIDSSTGKKTAHSQESRQFADLHQGSTSGAQDITLHQTAALSSKLVAAKKSAERQNVSKKPCPAWPKGSSPLNDKPNCPNTGAIIFQHTTSGQQTTTVEQKQELTQDATTPFAVQAQGADLGGEDIVWDVDADVASGGSSTATATQTKDWTQHASSAKAQTQVDRLRVRNVGLSPNTTTIGQTSDLVSDLGANQRCAIEGKDLHTKDTGIATTSCTRDDGDGTPAHGSDDGPHTISTDPDNPTTYEDQSKTPTMITGTVTDSSTHEPLAGAIVSRSDDPAGPASVIDTVSADSAGRYKFEVSPAATSTVEATDPGYQNASATHIKVPEGTAKVVNLPMKPDPTPSGTTTSAPRRAQPAGTQERRRSAHRR